MNTQTILDSEAQVSDCVTLYYEGMLYGKLSSNKTLESIPKAVKKRMVEPTLEIMWKIMANVYEVREVEKNLEECFGDSPLLKYVSFPSERAVGLQRFMSYEMIARHPRVQGCAAASHLFGNGCLGYALPKAVADGFIMAVQDICLGRTSFGSAQF